MEEDMALSREDERRFARERPAARGVRRKLAEDRGRAALAAASSPIPPHANERRDITSASAVQLRGWEAGHATTMAGVRA
jgi:hypothetical protein